MSASLTGSGLPRAKHCPAAYALPAVTQPSSQEASDGTEGHSFLQRIGEGMTRDESLALVPEHLLERFGRIDTSKVPTDAKYELAFAYDVATGKARKLNHVGHRNYDVADTEIPGTADCVYGIDNAVVVIDWKFAGYDHDAEMTWLQLEFYALCVSLVIGVSEAVIKIGIVNEDGSIGFHERHLDWEDLARVAREVAALHQSVAYLSTERREQGATWTPDVTPGMHCRWCPAMLHCPAKQASVRAFIDTSSPPNINDIAKAYAALKDAEAFGEQVKTFMRRALDSGEQAIGDGRSVRLTRNGQMRIGRVK